ncbi:hypothetical protein GCM10010123_40510 [Pilimelia anulata]|uniref:Uncharacterized protein n=1 Tax=Pilimelia anulata TaxID=53371 RepID=A0A8J3BDD2_9ACTN|nr:tyrosinase family oxidase copper chaperone [Pilimelia anulata]GGK06605.1 hypothetical protein GCM10010123_40510 [Pilimelia anulata]
MRGFTAALTTVLTAAGLAAAAAGPAAAARPVDGAFAAPATDPQPGHFREQYRGREITGWGRDEAACAFIDGVRLELYPMGANKYTSAVQAYREEQGVRAITRASVRVLGESDLTPPALPDDRCAG